MQTRRARQAADDVGEDLALDLDAAAHREQHLDQDEIVGPLGAHIRIGRIEPEVVCTELQHPLEAVGLGHARR